MGFSEALSDLPWLLQAILRLAIAAVLGGFIGLERERRGRSAGFRTQMLVGLGAALAMIVSIQTVRMFGDSGSVQVDPSRVAYGVMGGIGFLGAGAIITYGAGVRGLTTAASLWCTAAVGLACGLGMYEIATAAAIMVLLILGALARIDKRIPSRWYKSVRILVEETGEDNVARLRRALAENGIHTTSMDYARNAEEKLETMTFRVFSTVPDPIRRLRALGDLPGVREVTVT